MCEAMVSRSEAVLIVTILGARASHDACVALLCPMRTLTRRESQREGDIMHTASKTRWRASAWGTLLLGCALVGAASGACGDGGGTGGSTSTGATTGSGGQGTGGGASTSSSTGAGGSGPVCATPIVGPTRGSAIAITSNDARLVTVNRDAGTVTVLSVDYGSGAPVMTVVKEIAVGAEPWQVAINGCDDTAYVVTRKDQKLVEITGLDSASPAVGRSVAVGSEPTALALTPHDAKIYVSNWVDGTLSVVDPATMTVTGTVDLNPAIVQTGALGAVTPRASLAHPRALAVTNSGGASDDAEKVYATEWFAVRTGPEDATGTSSDHNWKGLLYEVDVGTGAVSTIDLPAITDTGFLDAKGQATGCFPNQIGSVTIDGGFAYVSSTCASPVGPVGVFQRGACTTSANCASFGVGSTCTQGVCTLQCLQDADCGPLAAAGDCQLPAGTCKPTVDNAKTTTHPAVTIVDLAAKTATTTALDKRYQTKAAANGFPLRVPLLPTDIGFHGQFAYVTGEGADGAFRMQIDAGAISDVGSSANNFIDLRTTSDGTIRLPIGVAMAHGSAFAFVADDGNRDVTALDLGAQTVANATTAVTTHSTALPAPGSPDESVLRGKRFFNTGLGRWSLRGQAWGSCGACHVDGLTDDVTWYFARGPRQTISLDGSFASADGTDQRILNWSGIFDEVADFEGNVRGVSGGVGAIVSATSTPPATSDRINTATTTPPQQGLQGSSTATADPNGSANPHSVIGDWSDITAWVKTVRSPRRPTNLVAADVAAGKLLFGAGQGNCVGCHSGAKWTVSTVFYKPNNLFNDVTGGTSSSSLSETGYAVALNNFPSTLLPSTVAANQFDRVGSAAFEQLACAVRPVGTIGALSGAVPTGVSPAAVGVLELRQDMKTGAQGSGLLGGEPSAGFNPPSLLGMQVGAPYFHAGNARTLEEVFDDLFLKHHQSPVAQVFAPGPTEVRELVAYLLSIDETEPPFAIPAKGATGGDLCVAPN